MVERFRYLRTALGAILAFVGAKLLLTDVYKVPIWLSLSVIAAILGVSLAVSLLRPAGRRALASGAGRPVPVRREGPYRSGGRGHRGRVPMVPVLARRRHRHRRHRNGQERPRHAGDDRPRRQREQDDQGV